MSFAKLAGGCVMSCMCSQFLRQQIFTLLSYLWNC